MFSFGNQGLGLWGSGALGCRGSRNSSYGSGITVTALVSVSRVPDPSGCCLPSHRSSEARSYATRARSPWAPNAPKPCWAHGLGLRVRVFNWVLVKGCYLSYHNGDLFVNNLVSLLWQLNTLNPLIRTQSRSKSRPFLTLQHQEASRPGPGTCQNSRSHNSPSPKQLRLGFRVGFRV